MTIHLIRMAAGLETVEGLRERQAERLKNYKQYGGKRGVLRTYTRATCPNGRTNLSMAVRSIG